MSNAFVKATWSGLRAAGFESLIRDVCFLNDVSIISLEVEKGWLRESGRFKIEGDESALRKVQRIIKQSIEEYNE